MFSNHDWTYVQSFGEKYRYLASLITEKIIENKYSTLEGLDLMFIIWKILQGKGFSQFKIYPHSIPTRIHDKVSCKQSSSFICKILSFDRKTVHSNV